MEIQTKTFKVFSYCDDFPEEMTEDHHISENPCGVYVPWKAYNKEHLEKGGFSLDPIAIRLSELGVPDDEEVLIEMDY